MKYERYGLLLPKQTTDQIDKEALQGMREASLGAKEVYSDLALPEDRAAMAREALHAGQDADLTATHLSYTTLSARLESQQAYKRQLVARDDLEPDLKQLYRWRINEDIANTRMLIASANGDMRQFHQMNEFIYGKPDEAIYRAALDWVANDADTLLATPDQKPAVVAAAQNVQQLLADKRGYRELLPPDERTFEEVRRDHFAQTTGFYGLLLAGVTIPEGKISKEIGDPILEWVISNNLESTYGIVDARAASWSVSHSRQALERPATYNLPAKRFMGLSLGHETGSHMLEKMNGQRGPLALLQDGFDRTEAGNEGRATIREQVPYDSFAEFGKLVRWRDILRRHIAISFASGVGEDSPRSSSQVYEFIHAIDMMYQSKLTPDDPPLTEQKATGKTDSLLLRVLKGTDGRGGAYLKDKVYLEGHVKSWLTAATKGPRAIADGDLGKYDINNERHIEPLQDRGLLPRNNEYTL